MRFFLLRLIYRSLSKYRLYTLVSIVGLTLGITFTTLVAIFTLHEWSYDASQPNLKKIYRVCLSYHDVNKPETAAYTSLPIAKAMQRYLDKEIVTTSLWGYGYPGIVYKANGHEINTLGGYSADTNFLKVFSFPLIQGNPKHLLDEPFTAVITRSAALALFGKADAIGGTFSIDTLVFRVTGIIENVPTNSQFRFDVLFSENVRYLFYKDFDNRWWESSLQSYALVESELQLGKINETLKHIKENDLFPEFREWFTYELKPFRGMHMDNTIVGQVVPPVTRQYLFILLGIALAVLLIACINYIIFAISVAEVRYRETGIYKIAGARRKDLIWKHMAEGILMSMISVYLALILARILLPWFNSLTGQPIASSFIDFRIVFCSMLLGLFIGILSSLYPGIYLARFTIVQSVRIRSARSEGSFTVRKTLLVIQLLISISLLSGEWTILRQLRFMQNHDLGYDANNLYAMDVYLLDRNGDKRVQKSKEFIEEFSKLSAGYGFGKATITEHIPGFYFSNQFKVVGEAGDKEGQSMIITSIDEHFMDVYGLQLLEGKNFAENSSYYYTMMNETAMRRLGWDNATGKSIRFIFDSKPITVIGVFKDIFINSLQHEMDPVIYRYGTNNYPGFITIRLAKGREKGTINYLKKTWDKMFPEDPYEGFYVKDKYLEKYGDEKRLITIIGSFSILSVFLALFGIIALIAFMAEKRVKEVGIRKVHGASSSSIIWLFSRQLGLWVGIGFILACPASLFIMHKWLMNFPYHTNMPWWVLVGSGLVVLVSTLMSVSFLIWQAARKNPVRALRYE